MDINQLYEQYKSNPANDPISDPAAIQERITHYTEELERTIKDSTNRKLPAWKRELASSKIRHIRKELQGWQDAYGLVVEELVKYQ